MRYLLILISIIGFSFSLLANCDHNEAIVKSDWHETFRKAEEGVRNAIKRDFKDAPPYLKQTFRDLQRRASNDTDRYTLADRKMIQILKKHLSAAQIARLIELNYNLKCPFSDLTETIDALTHHYERLLSRLDKGDQTHTWTAEMLQRAKQEPEFAGYNDFPAVFKKWQESRDRLLKPYKGQPDVYEWMTEYSGQLRYMGRNREWMSLTFRFADGTTQSFSFTTHDHTYISDESLDIRALVQREFIPKLRGKPVAVYHIHTHPDFSLPSTHDVMIKENWRLLVNEELGFEIPMTYYILPLSNMETFTSY